MEKNKNPQLELFARPGETGELISPQRRDILYKLKTYERLIVLIISFLITGTVFYCFGIEKGKRIAHRGVKFDLAAQGRVIQRIIKEDTQIKAGANVIVANPQLKNKEDLAITPSTAGIGQDLKEVESVPAPKDKGYYTIQVASYKTQVSAQREVEELKKKGFSSLILSKGKYLVVCVGKFEDKESAKSSIVRLKNKYQDCLLRRL
ncbi:MAG: SPOR domain-containing protein [Candidatus Omnitrophota bacterium]|nr:SPOR domain-containing protein [Candidatus Omnitrophota bacterium]